MTNDRRAARPTPPEPTGLARHLAVFVEDRSLWPILIILVVHVALGGALLLLAAFRERSLLALGVVAILMVLSADGIRRARQRVRVARWLALLWALAVLIAATASPFGLL